MKLKYKQANKHTKKRKETDPVNVNYKFNTRDRF